MTKAICYVVGIDGDKSPDPAYWRDRWERLQAASKEDAKEKWIAMREGWLRDDEKRFIFVDEVEAEVDEHGYFEDYFERRDYVRRK